MINEGSQLRDKGIKQAIDSANNTHEKWSEKAYKFLVSYIKSQDEFMTEDLRLASEKEIPVSIWGQIVDRFTDPTHFGEKGTNAHTGWDLLNAGTDLLWHKENPTITTYGQNATIVDGLCRAVA